MGHQYICAVNFSGNCPLWIEMESQKPTAYDSQKSLIYLESQRCGDNDSSRFTHRHEFGHYVMLKLRLIEYRIGDRELVRLLTDLLDSEVYPALVKVNAL